MKKICNLLFKICSCLSTHRIEFCESNSISFMCVCKCALFVYCKEKKIEKYKKYKE